MKISHGEKRAEGSRMATYHKTHSSSRLVDRRRLLELPDREQQEREL
jgi:hypothetical protein